MREQLVVTFLLPVLERILVEKVQVFGDLRLPEHLFVLLRARANHARATSAVAADRWSGVNGSPLVSR